MLSGPRNTLVRPYAATRSDRGQRKEFVHEDKHRIRPCRQTERARLRLSARPSITLQIQRQTCNARSLPAVVSVRIFSQLFSSHATYKQKITRKPSRNTFSVGDLVASSSKPICFGPSRAWHNRGTKRAQKLYPVFRTDNECRNP